MIRIALKACFLVSLILSLFVITACTGGKTEEPRIKITAANEELQVIYYGDWYNRSCEEIEKRLKDAMSQNSWEELPYIPLDETITIEVQNFETKELEINDYILSKTGEFKYGEKLVKTSVIPVNDSVATFDLISNPAVHLSSNLEDYEPGKTIRGIVLRSNIKGSPFVFAFIFRTDALDNNKCIQ